MGHAMMRECVDDGVGECRDAADSPKGNSQLKIMEVSGDRVFVPIQTDAGHIGDVQQTILYFIRVLQNRIGPILPFQPMRGLGDAHYVGGDFRI